MTKRNRGNATIITIVVILLIIFGIYYWMTRGSDTTYNDQTPDTTDTSTTGERPGTPGISTKAASFIGSTSAVLNGTIVPNGVQTSYWYDYGETSSFGSTTSPQLVGGGYTTYSAPATVTGLKANTTYYYSLTGQNQYGKISGQTENFKTAATTTSVPAQYLSPSVETKDATAITQNSASLNGAVNPNGSTTSYWFEYGDNFGLGKTTSLASAGSGKVSSGVSASISNLQPDRVYYYRLLAQNAYGTVNGHISVLKTQPGTAPAAGTPKAPLSYTRAPGSITSSSALLNGSVNPNGAATTYHFEYGKATPFGLFTLDQNTDAKSAGSGAALVAASQTLTGLDSNSTYYYQLVSVNANGTDKGAIYSFTTTK